MQVRTTRRVDALHQHALVATSFCTGQFLRSFFPGRVELWNALLLWSCGILFLLGVVLTALNHLLIGIFYFKGGICFLILFFAGRVVRGSADLMVHLHCLLFSPCTCI